MTRPLVSLIAAVARNGGIGRNGGLLVHLKEDLQHFKRITLGHPVIMGRKTWESIGRPLPGRRNIVLTRQLGWHAEGAEAAANLEAALAQVADAPKAFVIGGAQVYALALPLADELELTEFGADLEADTFFPAWDRARFVPTRRETHTSPHGWDYHFTTYRRGP